MEKLFINIYFAVKKNLAIKNIKDLNWLCKNKHNSNMIDYYWNDS